MRRSAPVEFLARQTVFVFVSHMPVYYWLLPYMRDWPRPVRAVPLVLICYVGLAVAGALVSRILQPVTLRDGLYRRFSRAA